MVISFLLLPLSTGVLRAPHPLCCMFLVYYSGFFCGLEDQSVWGVMLVYSSGGCVDTTCHLYAHLLVCWMSPKQVWNPLLVVKQPSCFLSVMWHGKALYGLGV
jgi:hypothetical protein